MDNIYIRFGTKLYRQIVSIPMGTNCAPLVADLLLFCYERDFMKDLSSDNQADVIKAKRKNMCVSCYISKKIRVGRSLLNFILFLNFYFFIP